MGTSQPSIEFDRGAAQDFAELAGETGESMPGSRRAGRQSRSAAAYRHHMGAVGSSICRGVLDHYVEVDLRRVSTPEAVSACVAWRRIL